MPVSPGRPWPLSWVYRWLACADPGGHADLIFVLAGWQGRKVYALELYREGRAPRILLSTARFEIRRFASLALPVSVDLLKLAAAIPPPQRHFFVDFEGDSCRVERISVRRFGTLGEIEALAKWLHARPQIRSLLVVSSGAHLRRIRMCCRALLPGHLQLRLIAGPDEAWGLHPEGWGREKFGNALILSELLKLFLYRIVLALRRTRGRSP